MSLQSLHILKQMTRHGYSSRIGVVTIILAATALLVVFSGNSAETDDTANIINTTAGKDFVITLNANATTGYEWQLANPVNDDFIELVNSEYIPDKTGLVGSGGKSKWTFKAIQAGRTQISFKYVRPCEKDAPPEKEIVYVVDVQESVEALETPNMIDQPPSAHWSDEEPGWGEESQDE